MARNPAITEAEWLKCEDPNKLLRALDEKEWKS